MLWTDATFVNTADLLAIDAEMTDVATANNVDVANHTIPQAIRECGTELLINMQRFGGFLSSGNISANHLAAVFNVGGPGVNRTRILLGQIVVDDRHVLTIKTWVEYYALVLLYRDIFARTKGDRFKIKMEQFSKDLKQKHWPWLRTMGIPIVYRPLPCPGAVNERSGTWDTSNVGTAASPGAVGGSFYVVTTYVDQSQYLGPAFGVGPNAVNNGQSHPSAALHITTAADQAIEVDITSLIPPSGQVDQSQLAQAIVTPYRASGWNVFVGTSATGPFYLQNASPIPILTKTYTLAGDPVLSGATPNGQFTDALYTLQDTLQRG
jgi:hypothetical protein